MNEATPQLRKIIEMMVGKALQRCHETGIEPATFYQAMSEERDAIGLHRTVQRLIWGTFRRLGVDYGPEPKL